MTAPRHSDRELCPDCGSVLPKVTITHSTVPVEVVAICPYCPGAEAKWAEHYEGDILRFPEIDLGPLGVRDHE